MTPLLRKTTNKLFFKRWVHKVVVRIDNANYIKRIEFSNNYLRSLNKDTSNLLRLSFILEDWNSKYDFQTRCEGDQVSFFTNDNTFIHVLENYFENDVLEIHSPKDEESEKFLVSNVNVIIREKLPKNIYRYKVYLNSKYRIFSDVAKPFYSWAEKYEDKLSIPPKLKSDLQSEQGFWPWPTNTYFYTSDDKILSMAMMFLGKHIHHVEKYVLKTELNG